MKKVLTNWVTYGAIAAVLIIWWGGSLLLASLVLTFACMATWRTKAWKGAFLLIAVAALVLSFIIPPPQQRETVQQAKDDVRKNLQGTSDRFNFVADRGLRSKVGDFSHLLQQHPELKDDLERITTGVQLQELSELENTTQKELAFRHAHTSDWEQAELVPAASTNGLMVLAKDKWVSTGFQLNAGRKVWANYELAKTFSGLPESLVLVAQLQPDGTWISGWVWMSSIQRPTVHEVVKFEPYHTKSDKFGDRQIIDHYIVRLLPGQTGQLTYWAPYWELGEQDKFTRGYRFHCESATLLITLNGQQFTLHRGDDVELPHINGNQIAADVVVDYDAQYPSTVVEFISYRKPKS